jgi:outer membrane receptor protein involved in Fe transport
VLDNGSLEYVGHYRQKLFDGRVDHVISPAQSMMFRTNVDTFFDTNPNDAVVGNNAPTVARKYTRSSVTGQVNHNYVANPHVLNETRISYSHGDPVTKWEAQNLSTTYSRSGSAPFKIGESRLSDIHSHQLQVQDTLTWSHDAHTLRLGASVARHNSGGIGSEPGQATLGTFTFRSTTTAPFDQLTLADVQNYSQPVAYGPIDYDVTQWLLAGFAQDTYRATGNLTLDLGLRYDRQTLTDGKTNVAPRIGFGWHPNGDDRTAIRGGYGLYYTQMLIKQIAKGLTGDLNGLSSYSATPGQAGFPTCLTGSCLPVNVDPATLPLAQRPARDVTLLAGDRATYEAQFAQYGLDFSKIAALYPDTLVNPKSQVTSIGIEHEIARGLFVSADYLHQHWDDLDSIIDINAPAPFERTQVGETRSVAAANATRAIAPVNGGVRQVNVLMNFGEADYDGLQTLITYRGSAKFNASLSYTLSKATNTTEPDGNGVSPNEGNIERLGEQERGPSVLDQRHRAVLSLSYRLPYDLSIGTVTQLGSARPFNAVTGVDNNGDGSNNDRPVIDGKVVSKSAFRSTAMQDVSAFVEGRIHVPGGRSLLLRLEGINLFNHANILGRAQQTYGDTGTPNPTFGQVAAVGSSSAALPSLSNIDPPRMFQIQARFEF